LLGSEFAAQYGSTGLASWEAAALSLAQAGSLTPWPWFDLPLADEDGNTAVLKVQSDVLAIGSFTDHIRLPLTPSVAQDLLNLSGALLPTPWLVYQIWRASPRKLAPLSEPNRGADLWQYLTHSQAIDQQLEAAGATIGDGVAGIKKHIVVSNIYQPGKVLIFGWYRPSPDVYDDGQPMGSPSRQPIQPKSNVHGAFYVDYSHGIQAVSPEAVVNGKRMLTEELYQHPTLSKIVSREGPIRSPRYPARIPPNRGSVPVADVANSLQARSYAPTTPGPAELGFAFTRRFSTWA
jgi:hypothetical protein